MRQLRGFILNCILTVEYLNQVLFGWQSADCGIVAIAADDACAASDGGIVHFWVADCDDINLSTITVSTTGGNEGQVTDITASVATPFVKFTPADDNTSFYNQEGERDGNKVTFNNTLFGQFKAISQAKVNTGNALKDCCCLFLIVETVNGQFMTMGIDWDATNGIRKSKEFAKATVNLLTDTGDNEDRLEVNVTAVNRCLTPTIDTVSFPQASLDALTVNP